MKLQMPVILSPRLASATRALFLNTDNKQIGMSLLYREV